jgi:hypothetical protein
MHSPRKLSNLIASDVPVCSSVKTYPPATCSAYAVASSATTNPLALALWATAGKTCYAVKTRGGTRHELKRILIATAGRRHHELSAS